MLRSEPFTIMPITADDGLERRVSAALAKCRKATRVVRASPIEAALAQLHDDQEIDAVILDRHTSGWVCAETCGVVARAAGAGVTIGLIGDDVVLCRCTRRRLRGSMAPTTAIRSTGTCCADFERSRHAAGRSPASGRRNSAGTSFPLRLRGLMPAAELKTQAQKSTWARRPMPWIRFSDPSTAAPGESLASKTLVKA